MWNWSRRTKALGARRELQAGSKGLRTAAMEQRSASRSSGRETAGKR